MVKKVFFFVIYIIVAVSCSSTLSPEKYRDIIDSGISLVAHQEYSGALDIFKHDTSNDTEKQLVFDFCRLMVYEAIMIDYESSIWGKEFDSLSLYLEHQFSSRLKKKPKSAWTHFYLGALLIAKGGHQIRFARYFDFTKNMLNGMGYIKRSQQIDSSIVDAMFYVTMYNYAKSRLYSWLPGLDNHQQTLASLADIARNGLFTRIVAAQALVALYAESKMWNEAEESILQFTSIYAENRSIRWILANAAYAKNNREVAYKYFVELQPLVEKIPSHFQYNRISLELQIIAIEYENGKYHEVLSRGKEVISVFGQYADDKQLKPLLNKVSSYVIKATRKLE